jgi:hypothetical protein
MWGVMHNGVRAFPAAVEATRRFREQGGSSFPLQLAGRAGAATSVRTASALPIKATPQSPQATRPPGSASTKAPASSIGPEGATCRSSLVSMSRASIPVRPTHRLPGLFDDETETPWDYEGLLHEPAERKLTMLCANPDHLVERGHKLVYCAGALAQLYAEEGGEVIYAGKPYAPIYELAAEIITERAGRKYCGRDPGHRRRHPHR